MSKKSPLNLFTPFPEDILEITDTEQKLQYVSAYRGLLVGKAPPEEWFNRAFQEQIVDEAPYLYDQVPTHLQELDLATSYAAKIGFQALPRIKPSFISDVIENLSLPSSRVDMEKAEEFKSLPKLSNEEVVNFYNVAVGYKNGFEESRYDIRSKVLHQKSFDNDYIEGARLYVECKFPEVVNKMAPPIEYEQSRGTKSLATKHELEREYAILVTKAIERSPDFPIKSPPMYLRLPNESEVGSTLITYTGDGVNATEVSSSIIGSSCILIRSIDPVGKDSEGNEVYNEYTLDSALVRWDYGDDIIQKLIDNPGYQLSYPRERDHSLSKISQPKDPKKEISKDDGYGM